MGHDETFHWPTVDEEGGHMNETIGWGILGPGSIATKFATDLKNLPDARLAAVGSRSKERAQAFAEQYGGERAYGSYVEMIDDPHVDIVYVSTPHPFHMEHTLLCLERGKAVLCEKPMEADASRVERMIAAADKKGLFLMEAMWTRYAPVVVQVRQWLSEGRIGDVRMLTVDFGFRSGWNPQGRLLNPELAGGAILDVGVYVVSMAYMVMGKEPKTMYATGHLGATGVDEQTAFMLGYEDGAYAQLSCSVRAASPQEMRIMGTEGSIHVPAFWHPPSATLQVAGQDPEVVTGEVGYHFEAAEAMTCLRNGRTQSEGMPWVESQAIARTLEQARCQIGLVYPWER